MILAGGGIHARPDSTAFNLELQRLAETIRSNVKLESDEGIVCLSVPGPVQPIFRITSSKMVFSI